MGAQIKIAAQMEMVMALQQPLVREQAGISEEIMQGVAAGEPLAVPVGAATELMDFWAKARYPQEVALPPLEGMEEMEVAAGVAALL